MDPHEKSRADDQRGKDQAGGDAIGYFLETLDQKVSFDGLVVHCEVLECEPPSRLEFSWSAGGPVEITNGAIDGDNVSFTVVREFGESKITQQFKGALSGGELKLTESGGRGEPHPVRRPEFLHYRVRVYIDNELGLPIRFEAYDWPRRARVEPELLEEYSYMHLKLNVGLRDIDFDVANSAYSFGRF